ncbi:MAG: UDP-N-acetylmuramoyl-tripeptide--D-alanyl-D-alanine ligase [Acidobacteria bacterium]|nr:UDP-N-acetylmuramoyl-tripeptide--D-alanyl-D-alanine ligase [Acidobacteriota bacterium]
MAASRVELTAASIARAMSGTLVSGSPDLTIGGFSIDSRTLRSGDVFFAIVGDRFDGHRFIAAAGAAGAGGFVVSDPSCLPPQVAAGAAVIHVADTTSALQVLARAIRRESRTRVVAVTGSAGKTTTKDVAAALLETSYRVFRTQGNLNNHIGLPLSLLELRHGPDIAVLEMGMNHAGEISLLARLAEPDVRVWTNVADVHAEFFASIEAIADAKAEILEGAGPDTLVIANAADPRVMARVQKSAARVVTFGVDVRADVMATSVVNAGISGTTAQVATPTGKTVLTISLLGRGHLSNALAGIAVALSFGVPLDVVADRASRLTPAPRRGEVWRLGDGIALVDDSYNSNPRALRGMLDVMATEHRFARRVAVLGEMLELGSQGTRWHQECGQAAAQAGIARLVTVGGPAALAMAEAAVEAGLEPAAVTHVATSLDAADVVSGALRPGDLVLVKGSHGVRMDVVADRVRAMTQEAQR